ncbi:MAG: serine--tRNA ligase [Streptomyces sp.]|uniref:serine--tRNA ligase n=1 Tax=Streptomyces sp. TaxID=1931 RepID=UPI0025EF0194|nr:serine--tRNA ligase [Streptomyces sp.]MBW8792485.1 serine--tRNA ligase [Streptomyces sp.]
MIDLQLIRNDPELVRQSQRARGEDPDIVDAVLAADEARRVTGRRFDELRRRQKELSKEVAVARNEGRAPLLVCAAELASEVKAAEADQRTADRETRRLLNRLSNVVSRDAPTGGEEDFVVLEQHGTPRDFTAEGFAPRDHMTLGRLLGAIDVERAAKVSGSRFHYLTGVGALLELALVTMAVERACAAGFTPMITPTLVRPAAMAGTGFLGQAADDVFRLEQDDFYLVGTSEVPLAAFHMQEVLDEERLPLRYAGFSSCFRREAGAYGRDTQGIFRVHQFDKVEMFSFALPEQAEAEHRRLVDWQKEFLDALELPYRVIDVAAGDLGASAARKFDIEAWIPSQGRYRELTSASNCTEFQARRLGVRVRGTSAKRPAATLNGTLCAVPRTIVALLENHQQADGAVVVPSALRRYLTERSVLKPTAGS